MAKIACVQVISSSNLAANFNVIEQQIMQAKDQNAELVLLPENFAFMGRREEDKLAVAESFGKGVIQDKVSALSRKYNLWIIAGTIPIQSLGKKARASSLVYDNKGKVCARYDKIHLFDVQVSKQEVYQESAVTEPGNDVVVVDTPVGKVGLSVCYDLRFPELYQQLVLKGAEIFSVPAAFTKITGKAHWDILLRARAIENLSYVAAANQGGLNDLGRHSYGHSMLVEPWGQAIAELSDGIGMIVTDIDLNQLRQSRQQFPCNQHHVLN